MLYTLILVLVILWALGFFGGFVTGNLIHLLLVVALVALIYELVMRRRRVA